MSAPNGFNWRCALGLHAWAKWSEPEHVTMTARAQVVAGMWTSMEPLTYSEWRQERACNLCGQSQRRVVES